jgi:hypothetical protein
MKNAIDTFLAAQNVRMAKLVDPDAVMVKKTMAKLDMTLDYLETLGEDPKVFRSPKAAQKAIREMRNLIPLIK